MVNSPNPRRRDRREIIHDLLSIASDGGTNGVLKTHMMYRANLSFEQLGKYVELLEASDMIERNENKRYELRPNGIKWLASYGAMQKIEEQGLLKLSKRAVERPTESVQRPVVEQASKVTA